MRTGSVLFLAGVLLLCQRPTLPPPSFALMLPPLLALLALRGWRWPAWIACGFLWALLRGHAILDRQLAPDLEGETLQAVGRVASLPVRHPDRLRFEFDIEELAGPAGRPLVSPGRVRLNWYHAHVRVQAGERWRLPVRLKRPAGFRNPGGFDYEAWLFSRRIRATGYVAGDAGVRLAAAAPGVGPLRQWLGDSIERQLSGRALAGMVIALVNGDQNAIEGRYWDVLAATGTSHLMAISGMHVGLVAAMAWAVTRRVWPCVGPLALLVAAPRAAAAAAAATAAAYAALAGFSVPTQRAMVMVLTVAALSAGVRRTAPSRVLATALLAVLVFDPFTVLGAGFWLSFVAVAVILFALVPGNRQRDWWSRWGRVHWIVALGLLPVLVWSFHQVPLLTIPANLLAVPWVSLLTVPLALAGSALLQFWPDAGGLLLELALRSLELLWPVLEMMAGMRGVLPGVPAAPAPALLLAIPGTLLLLMPRGFPCRWLGAAWMLPLLWPAASAPPPGRWHLAVLDVGQGLAAVVRTRNHALLYDTGPRFGPDFSAARAAVLPYLRHRGIRRLDLLMVSHGDNDHAGGVDVVLEAVNVDRVLSGEPHKSTAPGVAACRAGMRWRWDGVDFEVLHPPDGMPHLRGNSRSCVLRVDDGRRSVLLAGDIERDAEQALLAAQRQRLAAHVLIAPHHGSRTSSSAAFIAAVRPRLVIFAVGFRNRYRLPNQDIIARYHQHGATTLDTARSGAIELQSAEGLPVRAWRRHARRFWHSML